VAECKHDWTAVRERYVEGVPRGKGWTYPTMDELAEEFGVHPVSVRRRASEELWTIERKRRAKKRQAKHMRESIRAIVEQDLARYQREGVGKGRQTPMLQGANKTRTKPPPFAARNGAPKSTDQPSRPQVASASAEASFNPFAAWPSPDRARRIT
jgi:hypothetical protein